MLSATGMKGTCGLLLLGFIGCGNPTASLAGSDTGPVVSVLSQTGPMDFAASASGIRHETGMSPEGPMDQYDVTMAIAPSTSPNAGIVVGTRVPVYVREIDGTYRQSSASAILPGVQIEVWDDGSVAYGAAESPPDTPCYTATQIVIAR